MKKLLKNIKRLDKLKNKINVQTEELMKMYYSFIEQKPGIARSGFKNQITKDVTDNIFRKFNILNGEDIFFCWHYVFK